MKENKTPIIVGIIFLIFGVVAIMNAFFLKNFQGILWFCYISLIILGIGFLRKNHFLIKSQINILAIPLLIWTFDFIYFLIFKHSLLNIVNYFFLPGQILSKIITIQHVFTIPLAFYAIKFIKPISKNSWKLSFIQAAIIFILSRIFSNPEQNLNWVYRTSLNLNIPYYPLFWFIGIFFMTILTNFFLKKILKS